MSQSSTIEVSVGNIKIELTIGSRQLGNLFGLYLNNSDEPEDQKAEVKFSGLEAYEVVRYKLVDYLKMFPRNKDVQYILDKVEEGHEQYEETCAEYRENGIALDPFFHLYATVSLYK